MTSNTKMPFGNSSSPSSTGHGWNDLAIDHAIGITSRYVIATRPSFAHGIAGEPAKLPVGRLSLRRGRPSG